MRVYILLLKSKNKKKYDYKVHVCKIVDESLRMRNIGLSFGNSSLRCCHNL